LLYSNSLIVLYIKILIYRSKYSTVLVLPMLGLHWGNWWNAHLGKSSYWRCTKILW